MRERETYLKIEISKSLIWFYLGKKSNYKQTKKMRENTATSPGESKHKRWFCSSKFKRRLFFGRESNLLFCFDFFLIIIFKSTKYLVFFFSQIFF